MNGIKRRTVLMLLVIASLVFSLAGSAYAFSDTQKDKEKAAIESLQKQGILSGTGKDKFSPQGTLTVGNAVALIVKAMDLNIDGLRFIKEPKASDSFAKVKDDAWYAPSFIIAFYNGLDIPQNIDPNAKATREQFAYWLYNALAKKGEYAWVEMYVTIRDESHINAGYMDAIQKLLIGKIATLDAKGNFRPEQAVTRSEAAGMLYRALEFVKNTPPIEPANPETSVLSDVKLTSEKVGDDLLKVTVSATVPHLGYGLEIAGIAFHGGEAVVSYRPILPDPSAMYGQMVNTVKAVTYVSSMYTPKLGDQVPAESRKQETANGTKIVPVDNVTSPVNTKHPIRNPDGSSGSSGGSAGVPSGY